MGVTKIAAGCLILLTLSPVTAPFSTCDLASLLGSSADRAMPFAPMSSRRSVTNTPASLVPSARAPERARDPRSFLARTSARGARVVDSPARVIAATARGSDHLSPPLILRL